MQWKWLVNNPSYECDTTSNSFGEWFHLTCFDLERNQIGQLIRVLFNRHANELQTWHDVYPLNENDSANVAMWTERRVFRNHVLHDFEQSQFRYNREKTV